MNCHLLDYYTGVVQSYLESEEHTQGPEQFTRDWANSGVWKRAILRWKMFPGAEWGDGKIKSQTSMYTNVERVPLLQLHVVLRACFCEVPFIQTLSKTTLQLIKSSALAICWCVVINHGRGRGKTTFRRWHCFNCLWWGQLKTWCWGTVGLTPLLQGLMWLCQVRVNTLNSSHKDWLLDISQTSPTLPVQFVRWRYKLPFFWSVLSMTIEGERLNKDR